MATQTNDKRNAARRRARSAAQTRKVLSAMVHENTGVHMLDSGMMSGRHWQQNQGVDMDAVPASTLTFEADDDGSVSVTVTHNVYHWLLARVAFDSRWNRRFEAFAGREENKHENTYSLTEPFLDELREKGFIVRGLYGDGEAGSDNSYNSSSVLSQEIQFTYAEITGAGDKEATPLIFLQVHGGADIRGGYTDVKVFRGDDDLFSYCRASIYCAGPAPDTEPQLPGLEIPQDLSCHYWDTDDSGSHWYPAGSEYDKLGAYTAAELKIDEDGNASCPICQGRLRASF